MRPATAPTFACLALLVLLPLAPPGSAANGEVSFKEVGVRVGDKLLYRIVAHEDLHTPPGEEYEWDPQPEILYEGEHELYVHIEGPVTVVDAFGAEKPANAALYVRQRGEEVLEVSRCYDASTYPMRRDYLDGGPVDSMRWDLYGGTLGALGETVRFTNTTPVSTFGGVTCGMTFSSGSTVSNEIRRYGGPVVAGPEGFPSFLGATAPSRVDVGTFHGRTALTFVHPLSNELLGERSDSRYGTGTPEIAGELSITVAEGYPGAVRIAIHKEETFFEERRVSDGSLELIGYEPGERALPHVPLDVVEGRNPSASFVVMDRFSVPDELFGFPYPFEEAFDAMLSDPRLGLAAWLAAHPDAGLQQALYDRHIDRRNGVEGALDVTDTDGGWAVAFSDGDEGFEVISTRHAALTGPAGAVALPQKVVVNTGDEFTQDSMPLPPSYEILSPGDVAAFLAHAGIDPASVQALVYVGGATDDGAAAYLTVSQVPIWGAPEGDSEQGLVLDLDMARGRLGSISTTEISVESSGLFAELAPPRRVSPPAQGSFGLSAFGLTPLATAAAATGLALLLALLTKLFLVPLYTRLRRDRLLDNPVRARLFDRVRAEPGIHLAELEEYLGIGKGATRHHVDQLVKHRLVFLLEEGGYTRAYVSGHVPPDVARRTALLRAGSHQRVYEVYAASPGLPLREAAKRLGMSAPSVHRAKKKLETAGLLPAAPVQPPATFRQP